MSLLLPEEGEEISEIVLLQAGPSFFAFEPVLNALKTAPIPLAHIITQPPIIETVTTGFWPFNARETTTVQSVHMGLPQYAEEGGTFDLSFLLKPTSRHIHKYACAKGIDPSVCHSLYSLTNVDASRPQNFPLESLIEHTTFDRCQAEAIKAALTQEIPLIQGPPGTGPLLCIP